MTKRIYRAILLVAMAVFLSSTGLILVALAAYSTQDQHSQLRASLSLAVQGVQAQGMSYLQALPVRDYRITWIDPSGTVLFDDYADPDDLDDHADRTEVRQALETGYGESTRYSHTLTQRTVYAAQRLADGSVLRLSVKEASLVSIGLRMLLPVGLVFLLTAVLAIFLAWQLSQQVVMPLNRLNLDDPMSNTDYKELTPLFQRMDQQQRQLQDQQTVLLRMQQEFDTVTKGMQEGLVLLNNRGQILGLNPAAAALLGIDRTHLGQDILAVSRQLQIDTLLLDALAGNRGECTLSLNGSDYQVDASPVFSDGCLSGVVLLLFDITQKLQAETMRREFTANVSHELKIPLQSISGYAELMVNGMVKSEDIVPFSQRIYDEAQHMIRLVADILSLSRLDEGAQDLTRLSVDLYSLASETLTELESKAAGMQISLRLQGGRATVQGVRQLLSAVIHNLCDNAIKYNRPGGSVTVTVTDAGDYALVAVQDTGIGIPDGLQERIFERFFRADKSHNRQIEGTGLGLSIVKHAVAIHQGRIQVDSVPGEGTAITVRLPKS